MKISIEIDNDTLSKLVNDEIGRLDGKAVHDIAVCALRTYLSDPQNAARLVFGEGLRYNELRPEIKEMLQSAMRPDDIREFIETIMSVAKEHGKELVMGALAECLADNLFTYDNSSRFANRLMENIRRNA